MMLNGARKRLIMVRESIVMALDNIRSNRVRSFLTLLGIMIGVMAVITLITTVSGVSGTLSSSFSSMGVGTLTVSVTGSDLKSGVTPEDLEVISNLDSVDGVVPSVSLNGRVSYGNNVQSGIAVSGRNSYYFILNQDMIVQGRPLNYIDDNNSSYVCVISQEIVDKFFLGKNPIGETLYISGLPFTIVGRYQEDSGGGVASIFSGSPAVLIPYTTAMQVNNSNGETLPCLHNTKVGRYCHTPFLLFHISPAYFPIHLSASFTFQGPSISLFLPTQQDFN